MKTIYLKQNDESGGALMIALIATTVLAGMAGAVLAVGGAAQHEHVAAADHMKALYVAEAGLSEGIAAVMNGAVPNLDPDVQVPFSNGSYSGTVVDNGDDTTTITAVGSTRGFQRAVEAVLQQTSDGIFSSALFAGNSSGDPNYDMKFGGTGLQADDINGNVYSGGNIALTGTASIDGVARATGSISGVAGEDGVTQPIPDIVGMNYAVNNDVDVKAAFDALSTYGSGGSYGGSAWQLPESNPAHIFRKNPSDRVTDTAATAKDDYFLEDMYEPINSSATIDSSGGSHITISGLGGEPGANGNELVYYIDGNLWIHNRNLFSFTLWNSAGAPVKLTLVVKGNIYISDNIFYDNPDTDGLAMIAIKDSAVANSGNIYFGDPTFGTLEYMDSFMYAENNFFDNNLSASGSAKVTVNGNMTAGNQVKINRDFGAQHSKLTVNFDSRIWDGDLTLPGLPSQSGADPTWIVASWREVSVP